MRLRTLTLSLFACVLLIGSAAAQFTVVTGTVTDPNGVPYAFGTISATLVLTGAGSPTLNGFAYTPPTQPVGLNSAGSFTMRLADNAQISPAGTKWNFLVCSAIGTIQPAGGKGPVCFTLAAPITITGASQSISANLNAVAAALSTIVGGSGTVTSIGTTAPITGGTITTTGTIACATCAIGPGASTAGHVATFAGTDGITLADGGAPGGTTINPTNNVLPKRSNATTFVDSALTDNGTVVSSSEQLTWPTGLGAITQVLGPTDQSLTIRANSARALNLGGNNQTAWIIGSNGNISPNLAGLTIQVGNVAFASLPASGNGAIIYCTDCNATCTAGGGTGRMCFRENGAWTH